MSKNEALLSFGDESNNSTDCKPKDQAVDHNRVAVQCDNYMNSDVTRDLLASHGLLNYLNATMQGRWAFLNVLDQLSSVNFQEAELQITRDALERLNLWIIDLYQGNPIISATWAQPETFEAIKAVDLLRAAKKEIIQLANVTKQVQGSQQLTKDSEESKLLAAGFARYAYARDAYIRGFTEYGRASNNLDLIATYEPFISSSGDEIQVARFLINGFLVPDPDPDHHNILLFRAQSLPGIFRTHAHDMNQLLASFTGGFSFPSADFSSAEATSWNQVGLGPVAAGYWRAYEFTPVEAAAWNRIGITEAGSALEWKKQGFGTEDAGIWADRGFPPGIARKWREQQYTPERALPLVQRGFSTPDKIPPRKEEEEE